MMSRWNNRAVSVRIDASSASRTIHVVGTVTRRTTLRLPNVRLPDCNHQSVTSDFIVKSQLTLESGPSQSKVAAFDVSTRYHHLPISTIISINRIIITRKRKTAYDNDTFTMTPVDHLLSHLTIYVSGLPTVSQPLELFYPQHRFYHHHNLHSTRGDHEFIQDNDIMLLWRLPSVVAAYEVYF